MASGIICNISRIKDIKESVLKYSIRYRNNEEFLNREEIFLHRFINNIVKDEKREGYYFNSLYVEQGYIDLFIPFIGLTKDSILFKYEYYKDVYKTNSYSGMINKKYVMDYYTMNLLDFSKLDRIEQNMILCITFLFEK